MAVAVAVLISELETHMIVSLLACTNWEIIVLKIYNGKTVCVNSSLGTINNNSTRRFKNEKIAFMMYTYNGDSLLFIGSADVDPGHAATEIHGQLSDFHLRRPNVGTSGTSSGRGRSSRL